MLSALERMCNLAQNKTNENWQNLNVGDVLVYEGMMYLALKRDSDNPNKIYLLTLCNETNKDISTVIDSILDKNPATISSKIVQRSLGNENDIEVTDNHFIDEAREASKYIVGE